MKNEIILFEEQGIKLEVIMKNETVWLNQEQMGKLFGKAKSTINEHIKNIYKEEELLEIDTKRKFGNSEFSDKPINYYNLDMIISVGYRVKSKNGILFRRWATKVLKDYLIKGYAVNNKITYEECIDIINKLKFNNNSNLFALERNKGLKSIIDTIYSTYDNKDLYPSIEEKCSNLLYLVTKNHVFIDGNKRIMATLFIYFLNYYNILNIDNNTLVALTILIAESNPKEKEVLIDLIMNFLVKD